MVSPLWWVCLREGGGAAGRPPLGVSLRPACPLLLGGRGQLVDAVARVVGPYARGHLVGGRQSEPSVTGEHVVRLAPPANLALNRVPRRARDRQTPDGDGQCADS